MKIKNFFLNERNILVLIILNAILIFFSGFDFEHKWSKYVENADNLITILFVVELIIKFYHYGVKKYFSSYWNTLDFLLVALSIPPLVLSLFNIENPMLSFLLVFRVMRVFKSFRFLKFIPEIKHIILGIKRAVKTSILIVIAFFIYVFIVGIVSFNLFQDKAPEYFDNPLKSMYSTFKIFTIDGWYEIPEYIIANENATNSFFILLYFIGVLISGGILGLSLVNSIFVDAMVSDNNDDIGRKVDLIDNKLNEILKKYNNGIEI